MRPEWNSETVAECLVKVPAPNGGKLQTKDYKRAGKYPIIDQSQDLIAGWTDDEEGVISSSLPLIVFGDHTRAFKYVDFPFVRGADGTQLLKPRTDIDPLYFFYACRAVDLPSRGYNRHFTILKEKEIPLPLETTEQQAIGKLLQRVEQAIDVQSKGIQIALELKQSTMHELFTRGLRGEAQKETEIGLMPENWEIAPFDGALSIAQGQVDPRIEPYASMLHIGPENVESNTGHLLKCKTAKELELISGKYKFSAGDIVYSKIRPYLNKVVIPDFDGLCSADMYPLQAKGDFNIRFLFHYMLSQYFLVQAVPHQLRTGIPKINREQLATTAFPKPGTKEQREIADILDAIDRKIDLHKRKKAVLEELFQSLLHKLMTGEIRVADLDLSAFQKMEAA